ncbi:MAG: KPN_02809 family neutral zinc metallopeptidase, partial [Burkholderiales bacterium]
MRIEDERESDNVEDMRGASGGGFPIGGRGLGIGGVLIALAASFFFGIDPSFVLNLLQGVPTSQAPVSSAPAPRPPENDPRAIFVSRVLASTEDTWSEIFSEAGRRYVPPKLVLFTGSFPTACGLGRAAAGPFYCPADAKVYIDLRFYDLLRQRFHATGDFAEAYVIAHEVGHHVQNLLGVHQKMEAQRGRISEKAYNALSVRLELQADCYAGVWANRTDRTKHFLEPGDVEEAINAATVIGDDALQKQAQGYVVPDSFTHGTSAQR